MSGSDPTPLGASPSQGALHEMADRAGSFGGVASHYERYRPGPPVAAVDWFLPRHVGRVVDLGAGTGALTRLLIDRADEVVAVEPDDRMRSVLTAEVPGARAVKGRGESMPLPDSCADAVLASSSWHWMDPIPTLHEVARVLAPGGLVGAVWSGPDPEGLFMGQVRAMLAAQSQRGAGATTAELNEDGPHGDELQEIILGNELRSTPALELPPGVSFDQPEHEVFTWDVALNADDLIGLLGTISFIITLPDQRRERVMAEARRLLRELL
ncbi:MAG: class I SAM-dependent methyltransferase, partial [Acidimicrobiia bacterium]